MKPYVCFLRGINVGGNNKIRMADWKSMLEELGYSNPRTHLNSGNAVFESKGKPAEIEAAIAAAIKKQLGISPDVTVRSKAQLEASLDGNPFTAEAKKDPSHLLIMFLADKPSSTAQKALAELDIAPEAARLGPHEAYLWYPGGIGTSKKLARVPLEKLLGTRGTARNWKTVSTLLEMMG